VRLEVKGLTIRYGNGANLLTAVDRVDVAVPSGRTLGLVGESGCGKSTLARAIVGLLPVREGQIQLDGIDYTAHSKRNSREFRRRVQMIFQDPYSSLNPRMTVAEAIAEAYATRGVHRPGSGRKSRVLQLLDMVGLGSSALPKYPHQFSGGQRQRIAIARALAVGPELIINDEVTSALDVSVQATILNLLKSLQRELGLSYLFISHDLSTVRFMSDAVAVMYLGRIVEIAGTDELFAAPHHPYTQALIGSIPQIGARRISAPLSSDLSESRRPPSGCRFYPRCPVGPMFKPERVVCLDSDPQDSAAKREHRAACHFAGPRADAGRLAAREIQ
jgi:peptide/nickel transport system ATP-binding protein